ncbi:MAG: histidine kinase dimerization/phospho-acceptor domain-containing protein [Acidobacteriota bacterium]
MQDWLDHFAATAFRRSADTAHDLKTPLNVAVLNLELLRMRLAKLIDTPDEKLTAYAASIETELRRMARIFDAFFLLSAPPKGDEQPRLVDVAPFAEHAAGPVLVRAHESRIREAFKLFFDGAAHVLSDRTTKTSSGNGRFEVTVEGIPQAKDFELTKIFKFYYSDPNGNPDLSLAAARLIAETYGGELLSGEEHDKVWLRLSFPLGEK